MEKKFVLSENIEVFATYKKTRNGFKHEAELFINNRMVDKNKVCYLNRTWESYQFQTVIRKLVDKTKYLTNDEKSELLKKIDKSDSFSDNESFNSLKAVCAIGNLLCENTAEKNEWKKRMIKATFNDSVQFPSDWDKLSENEKERRLNLAVNSL